MSLVLAAALVLFFANGFLRNAEAGPLVLLVVLALLLAVGLRELVDPHRIHPVAWQDVIGALVGAVLTAVLIRGMGLPGVLAASLVGVLAGLLLLRDRTSGAGHAASLYVGAFAGMSSPVVLLGPAWVLVAGLATGVVWSLAKGAWLGVGGKMGTVAFSGGAIAAGIAWATGRLDPAAITATTHTPLDLAGTVLAGVLVGMLTHWLAFRRGLGPVLSSALPVAVIALIATIAGIESDANGSLIVASAFGGSFVGMTAPVRARWGLASIALMGVVFAVLLLNFRSHLAGVGGDLGATAASAVIAVLGLTRLSRRSGRMRA